MSATPETLALIDALLRIEQGWALIDRSPDDLATLRHAIELGADSAQLRVRAAALLDAAGEAEEARAALAGGLSLDAPPAPLQLAYARQLHKLGERDEACRWLRGAMRRARPDAGLALELAEWEETAGRAADALALRMLADQLPCGDAAALMAAGQRAWREGRRPAAAAAFERAFKRGHRDGEFLASYHALLREPQAAPLATPERQRLVAMMAAQAKLAGALPAEPLLASARAREASAAWVPLEALSGFLAARVAARAPFSWVRLGDGEARFLIHQRAALRGPLDEEAALAAARPIWATWFGHDIAKEDGGRLADLADRLDGAVARADLLGVASAARLLHDPGHYGWCATLERHVAALPTGARRFTEALFTYPLNEADPFLSRILTGADFLGVIGPHPALAGRLAARFGIAETASYDIPGEGRLGRAREAADRGTHFPRLFDRILATLTVPRPGALFLVAGGLLGKIYCDRVRALGGIALDIGALADAWMGFNTRGTSLDGAMAHRL